MSEDSTHTTAPTRLDLKRILPETTDGPFPESIEASVTTTGLVVVKTRRIAKIGRMACREMRWRPALPVVGERPRVPRADKPDF
jgi:hypothetical protein